ncbi:unnamed protein product [Caenorhabditis sp. 36 PRJEB53466]|nr:unnamed protein product [Caenorhabditis sp. 36 PRJEB53466]
MFFICLLWFSVLAQGQAQFFEPEPELQFAGYAAINIPANNHEEPENYNYLPYSSQFSQQFLTRNHQSELQQQQQQLLQQQQLIMSQPQQINHLFSNANPIPKREKGNVFSVVEKDKETQQELPELTRSSLTLEHATYLSLINDKENFQVSGCGWDLIRMQCHDLFGLCKGGCRDFAIALNTPIHDCRCIPFGYMALLKLAGK